MVIVKISSSILKPLLCYPKFSEKCHIERIRELEDLGVKFIVLEGSLNIYGKLKVLGKGYSSLVVKAIIEDHEYVTLKIRRTDSRRKTLAYEAECLALANTVNVGPKLLGFTDNVLMYKFVEGIILSKWFRQITELNTVKNVLKNILQQCFRLDMVSLDHGELSRPEKHILITKNNIPYIIDFESASTRRKPANLLSIINYLFIRRKPFTDKLRALMKYDVNELIDVLRTYKKHKSRDTFIKILKTLNL